MKYTTISISGREARAVSRDIGQAGGWWVQFGDEQLVYAASNKWSDVANAMGRGDLEATGDIRKGDMHLVVQKGRTFQQAHPTIPVILDKGRYLVVEISKKKARSLIRDDEVCFAIQPLRENTIVFDIHRPAAGTARTGVADLVAVLDPSSYTADLAHLVNYPTRYSTSATFQDAADWAEARLEGLGYTTRQTSVTLPGGGLSRNVIAMKPGTAANPQQVIAIAHLDSVNHPGGPTGPAPGADDNASGSAGILALAGASAEAAFDHDIVFILCGGEEQGLHGSTQFVAAMTAAERSRTKAVLNMDMIGHVNTPAPTVLLEGAPVSQSLIDGLGQAAAQFTALTVQTSLNPFASDHVPFIDADIAAVLTIEGADGANDAIHTANDTLDRVDPAFALDILRMNLAFLGDQAGVRAQTATPPCDCDCGPTDGVRQLAMHYQMLLAQYGRLQAEGLLHGEDMRRARGIRATHDQLFSEH